MMKKPNNLVTKVVGTVVTTSLLASSCTKAPYNHEGNIYGEFAPDGMKGVSMINIDESDFTDEFLTKVKAVNKIVSDILSDKHEAKLFGSNPQQYLNQKEISFNIALTSEEKNVLLAFADKDINDAIKNNDINAFFRILKEKGYMGVYSEPSQESIRKIFKSEEHYQNFVNSMGSKGIATYGAPGAPGSGGGDDGGGTGEGEEGAPGLVPIVTIVFLAIGFEFIAIGQLAVYLNYKFWGPPGAPSKPGMPGARSASAPFNGNEPVFKLWYDNNTPIQIDDHYGTLIDDQVNFTTDLIMKQYPDLDEFKIRAILRINLEGYYGYRN